MALQALAQCDVLRESAEFVGKWRGKQPAVKEESITDWLLYTISERLPNVIYTAFTRTEEGRTTGADWEWWFVYRHGGYKFRVQAKRLNHHGDNYPSLAYCNEHGLQIEKLINDAKNLAERALPLYAFYCCLTKPKESRCRGERIDVGVYLISAEKAYQSHIVNGKAKVTAKNILSESVPLQCFVCCPLWTGSPIDPFISTYLAPTRTGGNGGGGDDDAIREPNDDRAPNFHEKLPPYVTQLLENPTEIPDWFESEYRYSFGDVRAIMIHDLRNDERKRYFETGDLRVSEDDPGNAGGV